jgi:hypothetical protein
MRITTRSTRAGSTACMIIELCMYGSANTLIPHSMARRLLMVWCGIKSEHDRGNNVNICQFFICQTTELM